MELDQMADRARYTQAILDSDAQKRLIVAGPGTGKTYTFQEALQRTEGDGLALTFINNLADELAQDLENLADASTFHGFCKHLLHGIAVDGLSTDFAYYPSLFELLADDLSHLDWGVQGVADDIDFVYQNLEEGSPLLDAALRLGSFYDAVGHTDAVYRVFAHFRDRREAIPKYRLIVVDEYQDFTLLETSFIDLLAELNCVLIAGDDDQALYGFRHASADYIRQAAADDSFADFDLPYCSRCPEVVVEAFHDIVASATERGLLADRIEKPFTCFLPGKRDVSEANPHLIHAHCSVERSNAPYMGRYIATQIRDIPPDVIATSREETYPTVLVIGPSPFLDSVYEVLREQFDNTRLKKSTGMEIRPAHAYRRLIEDESSRLSWRILAYLGKLEVDDIGGLISQSIEDDLSLGSLLTDDAREAHVRIAQLIAASRTRDLSTAERAEVEEALGESLEEAFPEDEEGEEGEADPDDGIPTIVCTSMSGAKGMSAAYVFIAGMVDGHFPRDPRNPTNSEVRKLLVSLTRTRVRCYLVSCGNYAGTWVDESTFLSWIDDARIRPIEVNRYTLEEIEAGSIGH